MQSMEENWSLIWFIANLFVGVDFSYYELLNTDFLKIKSLSKLVVKKIVDPFFNNIFYAFKLQLVYALVTERILIRFLIFFSTKHITQIAFS